VTVCDRRCDDLGPGDPCQTCGHWTGVHPGCHNPGLSECAICAVQEAAIRAVPEPPSKEKEKKMSVKDTLPEPVAVPAKYRLHQAVRHITYAMQDGYAEHVQRLDAGRALAHVRAARKALPDQGKRLEDVPDRYGDMHLLSVAGQNLLNMLGGSARIDGHGLRAVEAMLRTWLRRKR